MNIYDVAELQQYLNPQGLDSLYTSPTYISKQNVDPFFQPSLPFNNPTYLMKQQLGMVPTGVMTQAPLKNLGFDTSFGVANEEDVEQEFLPGKKKSGGIADLFRALFGFFVPGGSLLMGGGSRALQGIKSLNQRLRNTDFAKSKTLADYFDARKYGGRDERDAAAARNMAQARGIQKKIDAGDYGTRDISIDRGRGQITSRAPTSNKSRRDTSPSSSYSQASYARRR